MKLTASLLCPTTSEVVCISDQTTCPCSEPQAGRGSAALAVESEPVTRLSLSPTVTTTVTAICKPNRYNIVHNLVQPVQPVQFCTTLYISCTRLYKRLYCINNLKSCSTVVQPKNGFDKEIVQGFVQYCTYCPRLYNNLCFAVQFIVQYFLKLRTTLLINISCGVVQPFSERL